MNMRSLSSIVDAQCESATARSLRSPAWSSGPLSVAAHPACASSRVSSTPTWKRA
jgi:hypothetical protein